MSARPKLVADTTTQSVAQRVQALQTQARALAKAHVTELTAKAFEVTEIAKAIADGGEVYPAGIREMASRLVDDLDARILTLMALKERMP